MSEQRLALQNNPLGLQPEQALVLETIGPIERFVDAVKRVKGLEWLGELELDDISPDHGFEDEEDPQKPLKGRLFLVMTDRRALDEILRFFARWRDDPDAKFPRGLAPLKNAFRYLYDIRQWNAEDRIRETGLLEDWQSRPAAGQEIAAVPFEAELWFRESSDRRREAEDRIRNIVEDLGGEVVRGSVIGEIAYHGILGRIPIAQASDISAQDEVELLLCEDIMHLRPVGQCLIRGPEDPSETETLPEEDQPGLPEGDPVIAILDGLPLTGHRLLDNRLIVDDPDDYEGDYQARERVHGTAMASLICHGDLGGAEASSRRPLYVRPILKPQRGFGGQFVERIPDDVLPLDLLHRAVRRLYESEDGQPPAAPSVRVINLSVCDRSRPFDRGMSSWARLVDWLSWKYNVLFVVSAGNQPQDIELSVPRADLPSLTAGELQAAVIEAVAADTRHRRLLSPAETLNGLTVGAAHSDVSTPMPNPALVDPFSQPGLPTTINAQGPGYRSAIKPEILLPGGRQFLSEKMGNTHPNSMLRTTSFGSPPGQRVATPGDSGNVDQTRHSRGTSNAAAMASRWAGFLFETIDRLRAQPGVRIATEYDAVLLKALLVHGADWDGIGSIYESTLKSSKNSRGYKDYVGRFFGYGPANVARAMTCADQRVTVLGVGELEDGEGQEFTFPLPPSLSAVTDKRRLTITLAWLTPVNSKHLGYRVAHLWFDPKNGLAPHRICADRRAVRRGAVQHEVLEGDRAMDFQDGDTIDIKINCRAVAGEILEPIRYGLAVTLEVADGIGIPIYQEVRDRIRLRVPVRGGRQA